MNRISALKIGTKIIIGFLMVSFLVLIVGSIGYSGLSASIEKNDLLYNNRVIPIKNLGAASESFLLVRVNLLYAMITSDESAKSQYLSNSKKQIRKVDSIITEYERITLSDVEKDNLLKFLSSWDEYKKFSVILSTAIINKNESLVEQSRKNAANSYNEAHKYISALIHINTLMAEKLKQENSSEASSSKFLMLIFIIAGILLSVFLGIFSSEIISRGIKQLNEAANNIVCGNYNVNVQIKTGDELGNLGKSFNIMLEKIRLQMSYLENLPAPVVLMDKDFSIRYMNKTGANLLGKTQNELIGKKCYDQFKTDDCRTENCACYQSMQSDKISTRETTAHFTSDKIHIMYTGNPIKNKEDQIIGALEYITDITEMKNLQNYLSSSSKTMLSQMEKFSEGDLTVSLKAEKNDDFGKLFKGFNKSINNISEMIKEVSEAILSTANAANEISSSSEEMAAGAYEQSQQTAEIASAVEEMTSTIRESSKNATVASENSKLASTAAKNGSQIVNKTKHSMMKIVESTKGTGIKISSLSEKTEQIGEIARIIDDIADQTNLLALNAAIEAARAGEQGRGFAVVADEVRKLAERTTKATKEISETIKSIQIEVQDANTAMVDAGKSVEEGMRLTEDVSESLEKIMELTHKVSDLISQVAAGSEQQSTTAEQISKNIEGISSVTQQNAAGIQQIARAGDNLSNLTINLQNLITRFKLKQTYKLNQQTTGI